METLNYVVIMVILLEYNITVMATSVRSRCDGTSCEKIVMKKRNVPCAAASR